MCEAEDIKDSLAEETDGVHSERVEARECVVVTTAVVSNVAASTSLLIATTICVYGFYCKRYRYRRRCI